VLPVVHPGSAFRVQDSGFRVQGSGSNIQGSGFRVQGSGCRVQGSGFRVQDSGFRVQDSGFRVQCSVFRVQGSGSRVQVLGFRVQGLGFRVSDTQHQQNNRSLVMRSWQALYQGLEPFFLRKGVAIYELVFWFKEGRCKATWKREFKLPWRKAGPPNHLDDKMDSDH